eukprot:48438_1
MSDNNTRTRTFQLNDINGNTKYIGQEEAWKLLTNRPRVAAPPFTDQEIWKVVYPDWNCDVDNQFESDLKQFLVEYKLKDAWNNNIKDSSSSYENLPLTESQIKQAKKLKAALVQQAQLNLNMCHNMHPHELTDILNVNAANHALKLMKSSYAKLNDLKPKDASGLSIYQPIISNRKRNTNRRDMYEASANLCAHQIAHAPPNKKQKMNQYPKIPHKAATKATKAIQENRRDTYEMSKLKQHVNPQ